MMRGRKKQPVAYRECICIKLTEEQKDIWSNNKWIADEVRDLVRKHIDLYAMKK